jgi:hypothetical protein
MENEEQPQEEVVEENAAPVESAETTEPEKLDRPEENYKAEIARHKAEVERLKIELATKATAPVSTERKRDQNDISTWTDHELKMLQKSKDANIPDTYRDQAEELLIERKVQRIHERNRETELKVTTDVRLKTEYPETSDPNSEFSLKMEQVMREYDLHRTPAGKLAAARIVAADMKKGTSVSDAKGRKIESDRVARVKGQMVDGDRPKPADVETPAKKIEEIEKGVRAGSQEAFNEALKLKGMTREQFFKR